MKPVISPQIPDSVAVVASWLVLLAVAALVAFSTFLLIRYGVGKL